MTLFAIATLVPVPLLLGAALWGGPWAAAALIYVTLFTLTLDMTVRIVSPAMPDGAEFPAADRLSAVLACAHFVLLAAGVWAVSGGSGVGGWARAACFVAFGQFFGQVSNANAHELIHRRGRALFRLGMWVYISLLFGHHTSAHRHVHHRFVATLRDPNSAPQGMGFYAFAPRAWVGSFTAGWACESTLRRRAGRGGAHPYAVYLGGAALFCAAAGAAFGWRGLAAYLALAGYAQMQLLLSDYVQHYGLVRADGPNGRPRPVEAGHSWNARHWYSSALMLNAPRHSDHHAHPARHYPALELPARGAAPMLPYSLPLMAAIALVPPLWRRVMDRRVARWKAGRA